MTEVAGLKWSASECRSSQRVVGLDDMSEADLVGVLGEPLAKETFRIGDALDEERIVLQNRYPLSTPANKKVTVRELRFRAGQCGLTVWLHEDKGRFVSFENRRYPLDADF